MIPVSVYKGKDVALFGLGRTGISAARALMAGGARVHAWDDNEISREKAAEAGLTIADINKMDWQKFSALVLSPGIPFKYPEPHRVVKMAKMVGVPVVGDMELFARAVAELPAYARPKIVGITGTNGKSTTTALIGHILERAGRDVRVGGNIGVGVLDLKAMNANSIYVLELSSYQLDLIDSLRCDVAVFLNVSPDHLDRHGGMQGYVAAKNRIFRNQTSADTAVIGVDDMRTQILCTRLAAENTRRVCPVSAEMALGRGVSVLEGMLSDSLSGHAETSVDLSSARALPGQHNHQNAAAAYAACQSLGLDASEIIDGLNSFPGLEHRLESVGSVNGVAFVNDSKATNSQAAEQALRAYPNAFWIAGGRAKDDGIDALAPYFSSIKKAYLIGHAMSDFSNTLKGKTPTMNCGTLDVAVAAAYKDALASGIKDPVILFSPACASFDQFKDFEARGDAFKNQVHAIEMDFKKKSKIIA
ncbi:UDP-N-acetylmuramoyl-L-alanine--D-glutamate ligase [Hirschia baltica]|uniref:UDP-N-acetylmuramoylalanine--D-glutamate ligase n=1 Tax=Hirschia baltica (strain ATCC 49814 / DSM 5838 / IFAM 1418) TaxID=582402 RepID=C6XMF0_HIRBI|nr:UDP-N-acetylmuramoyl-L-alanine--D-glutamate ligase [Hirschia baltica]ACT58093.1 UDP-N-acetylmuramoylalanine/D-glutamate ligase [Hirschia baltica ATCC 49814]